MSQASTAETPLRIRAAGLTDAGSVRLHNEDRLLVDEEHGIFIVADGVGGRAYGDVAAQMVVDRMPEVIKRRVSEAPDPETDDALQIRQMLLAGLHEVSEDIRRWSVEAPESHGMGATVVVALLTGHHAHIAHMGDSRAYLLRDGALRQLTEDHSVVGLLLHHGEISPQEAEEHPARGRLTRFLGMEGEVDAAVQSVPIQAGDRLLLCTDGLWGMLPPERLHAILSEGSGSGDTCRALVDAANNAGGKDNLTALVVDVGTCDGAQGETV